MSEKLLKKIFICDKILSIILKNYVIDKKREKDNEIKLADDIFILLFITRTYSFVSQERFKYIDRKNKKFFYCFNRKVIEFNRSPIVCNIDDIFYRYPE